MTTEIYKKDILEKLQEARDTLQGCWDMGDWSKAVNVLETLDYLLRVVEEQVTVEVE